MIPDPSTTPLLLTALWLGVNVIAIALNELFAARQAPAAVPTPQGDA